MPNSDHPKCWELGRCSRLGQPLFDGLLIYPPGGLWVFTENVNPLRKRPELLLRQTDSQSTNRSPEVVGMFLRLIRHELRFKLQETHRDDPKLL